jgi:hypothetical protein
MSISIGSGAHKLQHTSASRATATRGRPPLALDPDSNDPRWQEFAQHIVRFGQRQPVRDPGFRPYRRGRRTAQRVPHGYDLPAEGRRGAR